jgi:hypothetical protein
MICCKFSLFYYDGPLCREFLMMAMRNCSVYPCGAMGAGVGAVSLAGGRPTGTTPIAVDVKLPLCSAREVSVSAMAYCPPDPAPHCGDHSHWVSTVNAESALLVRQIPRTFMGGREKSSVDCGHSRTQMPLQSADNPADAA